MTVYSARIEFVTDKSRPDDFSFALSHSPLPDFVVCRKLDGAIASVYSENEWDFSAYHPEYKRCILYFNCWGIDDLADDQIELIQEAKWIIFLAIFMRRGQPLSNGTIFNYLKTLKFLMRHCSEVSSKLSSILNDAVRLKTLCVDEHQGKLGVLNTILRFLYDLGVNIVGYEVIGTAATSELKSMYRDYMSKVKQHAPVPTRIYSSIIATLSEHLNEFELVSERVLQVAAHNITNSSSMDKGKRVPIRREVSQLIEEYGLAEYFASRDIGAHAQGLSYLISETLTAIALQVQLFTGMRSSEVRSLTYDCLQIETRDGREHYIVNGRTTKLNHGRKKAAQWVTSDRGRHAIELAMKIANVMYSGGPQSTSYLFVNVLLGANTGQGRRPANVLLNLYEALKRSLCIPIIESDLDELENIDPHRAWRSETEYQLGAPWPLKGHQLRRSLALYAQRSGLVTLPTLKRQLQHITEEMSRYYARGSAFANDFIGGEKKHIGTEWRETQPISQYLGYAAAVIFSDDELFGGHGNWVKHRLIEDNNATVLRDREVTIKQFQKGQLAFRETAIGGCVSTTQCDRGLLDVLNITCVKQGCKNLVGSHKKLDRAIAIQTKRVQALEVTAPNGPEYRSEQSDLKVLLSVKQSLAVTKLGGHS